MQKAKLVLDRDYQIGRIDPRIYGSFVEHLGRCVYGGLFEPATPVDTGSSPYKLAVLF